MDRRSAKRALTKAGPALCVVAVLLGSLGAPAVASIAASAAASPNSAAPASASSAATTSTGPTVYVSDDFGNVVYPIDATTQTVGTPIPVGHEPGAMAITPDGSVNYEVNFTDKTLVPISTKTTETAVIPIGTFDYGLAITPNGKTIYTTSRSDATVTPVDVATNTPETPIHFPKGGEETFVAITPNGKLAYVSDSTRDVVTPITIATNKLGTPIPVSQFPEGIAMAPDGKTAYVVSQCGTTCLSGVVTPITVATNTPGTPIPVGQGPFEIAVTPDGTKAYVANLLGSSVTPIDLTTSASGPAIPVTGGPAGLAVTPDGSTVFVAAGNLSDPGGIPGAVTAIATATNTPSPPISAGTLPFGVVISPDEAPVAVLSVTPEPAGSGLPTQFSAAGSVAPTSPIVSYQWNFGDGTTATSAVPATSHLYSKANTYAATVTETDAAGTSTTQVFTGQTVSRNGGPSAVANARVVIVSCKKTQTCRGTVSAPASSSTPPQSTVVSGRPTAAVGTLHIAFAPAKLACPTLDPAVAPVVNLTNTGFASTAHLSVTATLHNATRANEHRVCYSSAIPFKSRSSPAVAKPGTALLLNCTDTASVAPCVISSNQVGADVVVSFVIPGGDPRFHIVAPAPTRIGFPAVPTGSVGKPYTARLETMGGLTPIVWKVVSGKLPSGLRLNPSTGGLTGKPTTKGQSTFMLQCADGEQPAQTAKMSVTITVK